MKRINPIKLGKAFKKYGDNTVSAEVFNHPDAITGGVLVITDCLGKRYYEDRGICGIDLCLEVARTYKS
jgi:hypothetical protein